MALEAAVGPISEAEELLGESIANATYFLTFTSETTVLAAKEHIYYGALPKPTNGSVYTRSELESHRPFCLIYANPSNPVSFAQLATGNTYRPSGSVVAMFERKVPTDQELDEADRSWNNTIGALLRRTTQADSFVGILDQSWMENRLIVSRCNVQDIGRIDRDSQQDQGDHQWAVIEFEWGLS